MTSTHIPQTANFPLMLDVLAAVKAGQKHTSDIAHYLMLDSRQVRYHIASLSSLGFVKADGFDLSVTDKGEYVQTYTSLYAAMVDMPAVKAARNGLFEFVNFALSAGLSAATAKRRFSTVKAWARSCQNMVTVAKVRPTICPSCFIALPKLAKDECDTCGEVL
jgi:hypothetical protein